MTEWCHVCVRRVDWLSYCLHCGTKVNRRGEAGKQPIRRFKFTGKIRDIVIGLAGDGPPMPYEKSPHL
jgi:hypothetical protein